MTKKQRKPAGRAAQLTGLAPEDRLPLTCTRAGTCCHGKEIWLNPWELACLAAARGLSPREFRDRDTVDGGMRLRVDGPPGWRGLPECSQYSPSTGCLAYPGRPLACRLFPLGRKKHRDRVSYVHEGQTFPCLAGCPEVTGLSELTVREYLAGQQTAPAEAAQEAYIELVQTLADDALHLFLDCGLSSSKLRDSSLRRWREWGGLSHAARAEAFGMEWHDALTAPRPDAPRTDPAAFAAEHGALLERKIEAAGAGLKTLPDLERLCGLTLGLSLHLGAGLGLPSAHMARHWIDTARRHLRQR